MLNLFKKKTHVKAIEPFGKAFLDCMATGQDNKIFFLGCGVKKSG